MRVRPVGLGVLLAAALVAGGAWFQHWRTHPTALPADAGTFWVDPKPLAEADVTVAVTHPALRGPARTLVLHAVTARLAAGSAPAEVTFWVCRAEPPIEVADGSPGQNCAEVDRLDDSTVLPYGPGHDAYVVARIHPRRTGAVRLVGVDLDYAEHRRGPDRSGVQRLGMDYRVTAR